MSYCILLYNVMPYNCRNISPDILKLRKFFHLCWLEKSCSMAELLLVDDALWVWNQPIGIGVYDFDFRSFLPCRQPRQREEVTAVVRSG